MSKISKEIVEKFDEYWLYRYPKPLRCIHDQGKEFIGHEFKKMLESYGIRSTSTSVKNP